ncbi:uncharacterized protein LOC144152588 [Haemaphysalis longicornis]
MRQVHDGNSAEALPTAAEQTPEVDNILFSSPSLYTIIGVLTLAVLFCAGVLAYTVRRNDLLKSEYYRLMAAVAERGSKGARSTFDPDFPDTVETMGPGPKVEDTTRDVLMLLVTRKSISNTSHPNRTRRPHHRFSSHQGCLLRRPGQRPKTAKQNANARGVRERGLGRDQPHCGKDVIIAGLYKHVTSVPIDDI